MSSSRFTTSIAPTGRAKCKGCKLIIEKGSLRVSREVPSTFTGDKGLIVHHYHFLHGMHAATRVRCASTPPSFISHVTLNPGQKNRAKATGEKALVEWKKRCNPTRSLRGT